MGSGLAWGKQWTEHQKKATFFGGLCLLGGEHVVANLVKKLRPDDFQGFAQLLTAIERTGPAVLKCPELLAPTFPSFRLGVTGPPGAGKSTIIGQLIKELRQRKLKVGIMAVDPSSPFSRGAILGDRIRYMEHCHDQDVFVRSLGSRGSLGGLSAAAYLMLRAYDLMKFDLVLIETVGVGQSELEIMHVADWVNVVLVPESGDSVQAMKAGLLEIADVFVVNKADRPGADSLARELRALVKSGPNQRASQVIKTSALRGEGIKEFAELILTQAQNQPAWLPARRSSERLRWEARALLRQQSEQAIDREVETIRDQKDLQELILKHFMASA